MSITLELPQTLENELSVEAKQLGLPLSQYLIRVLTIGTRIRYEVQTGADLVDYWYNEGLIGSRSDIVDSQEHARMLRQQAEQHARE